MSRPVQRRSGLDWSVPTAILLPLAVWELSGRMGWVSPLLFPAPTHVLQAGWTLFSEGPGGIHLATSLRRLFVGALLGGSVGLVLGLAMGYWPAVRRIIDPIVSSLHPIPKIAVLPLIMVVLGIGESTKYAVIAIAAFFPLVINTMAGVRQIHPIHFEVARNYGAGGLSVLRWVVLPGSLPMILAGARLGLNSALVITIAVELVSADLGLGRLIWEAWLTMRVELLYVGIGLAALIGIVINQTLRRLQERYVPWLEARTI